MPFSSYGLLKAVRSHEISSPTVAESISHGRPNACNLCHLDKTLEWTSRHLNSWFGQSVPQLSPDDREIAASVNWVLKGDAGQRALLSWAMGWSPAREASGQEWLYPFLTLQLNDSYAAVRFIAWKSLRSLPGFVDFEYTYTSDEASRRNSVSAAYEHWWRTVRSADHVFKPGMILQPDGRFHQDTLRRLLSSTDEKRVFLVLLR